MSPPPHHSSTLVFTRACPDMLWNTERGWRQKKTKQEKPEGMRERDGGGLREGKDPWVWEREKNVMLKLQFWVDSQKRSRTESERRLEHTEGDSDRGGGEIHAIKSARNMLSLTHSSFPSPSFLISDRAAPWSPTRSMVNCSISDSATQRSRRWERMKRCTFPDLTFFWLFFFFCQPYTLGPTGERQLAIIIAWCNTFRNWQAKEISSYCLELSHTHQLQLYHKKEWS